MGGEPHYEEGRRLYTGEINAAVRGAFAAGASEVVVMDCHGTGKGWDFSSHLLELRRGATLCPARHMFCPPWS
jgi:D-amino peptidase